MLQILSPTTIDNQLGFGLRKAAIVFCLIWKGNLFSNQEIVLVITDQRNYGTSVNKRVKCLTLFTIGEGTERLPVQLHYRSVHNKTAGEELQFIFFLNLRFALEI